MKVGLVAVLAATACASSATGQRPPTPPPSTRTPVISPAPDGATALACKTTLRDVEIAAEAYWAKHGHYPTAIDDARHSPTTLVGGGYLRQAPHDPGYTITLTTSGDGVDVRGDLFGGRVTKDCSG